MGQFNTAKVVLTFVIALGWLVVALGVAAFVYLLTNIGLVGALSAFGILASGLITVAVAQMGLAQIATAENTAAIYSLLAQNKDGINDQQRISGNTLGVTYTKGLVKNAGDRIKAFNGYEIMKAEGGVSVDGETYPNVLAAERAINEKIKSTK